MNQTRPPESIEIVVTAHDREADLDASIRRLHAYLHEVAVVDRSELVHPSQANRWTITIVDNASTDATALIGRRLARELDGVHLVQLRDHHSRRQIRSGWTASTATRLAFADVTPTTDLDALIAPLRAAMGRPRPEPTPPEATTGPRQLSRRSALASVGVVGLGAVLAACGASTKTNASGTTTTDAQASTSSSTSPSTTSGPTTTSSAVEAADLTGCVLATEMTQGPYYLDLDLVRSDIAEGRPGAPLTLTLQVVGSTTCAPVEGATVDIWHSDATGLYSGFVDASAAANGGSDTTDDGTFMRGTQITDSSGKVTFQTVYPGWYRGRTVHIHVMVHVAGQVVHTGQLFFDDTTTDTVFAATEPYSSRGQRDTRNSNDGIYAGGGAASVLAVGTTSPYSAALVMGIKS